MPRCKMCNHSDDIPAELGLNEEVFNAHNYVRHDPKTGDMLCLECISSIKDLMIEFEHIDEEKESQKNDSSALPSRRV